MQKQHDVCDTTKRFRSGDGVSSILGLPQRAETHFLFTIHSTETRYLMSHKDGGAEPESGGEAKQPMQRALSNSFDNPAGYALEILRARSLSGSSQNVKSEQLDVHSGEQVEKLDEVKEGDDEEDDEEENEVKPAEVK
eukprot:Gregarina_sp_Poly_1__5445@NODE_287_length_10022_cov_246_780311_g248_i0_p7_GENE_NODE_287_length_10022_cov_246_780311_g248_i0NODE_287_length_10022_cov_246_780311_g248_i0_p7_ORF_typecomplete_len138_score30_23Bact_transglu_N/PF08379_10/0_05DUF4611/PF15387_6/0_11_NODE_287_length_10022_cov_246_780311_g248_i022132626